MQCCSKRFNCFRYRAASLFLVSTFFLISPAFVFLWGEEARETKGVCINRRETFDLVLFFSAETDLPPLAFPLSLDHHRIGAVQYDSQGVRASAVESYFS